MTLQAYITIFTAFLTISAVVHFIFFIVLKKKGVGIARVLSSLFFTWSLFLTVFTTIILFNMPFRLEPERSVLNLVPLRWLWEENIAQRLAREIIPNIILFIPLGFSAPLLFKRARALYVTALSSLTLTLSIESIQFFIGRSSDIDDIIANLLGGIIGYVIFKALTFLFKNKSW